MDVVQVDLTHFGGFLPMKRLAGWADAYSLLMAPHNVCGPVGTMANLHFARPRRTTKCSSTSTTSPTRGRLVDHAPHVDPATAALRCPSGRVLA